MKSAMVIAVVVVLVGACNGDDEGRAMTSPATTMRETVPVESVPATNGEAPATSDPVVTAYTLDVPTDAFDAAFPPSGLPVRPDSEIELGASDLARLISGHHWLFGVLPPSEVVRIDPRSGEVVSLDLGLGASREGAVAHAFAAGRLWVLGGPFRDTLVEVDPIVMSETRQVQLDDDHGIRHGDPTDELWLSTLRGARPVDVDSGEVGELVPLEVDPRDLAIGDGEVWVTLPAAAQVARIDTADSSIELIDTEPGPTGIAVRDGIVWVTHPPTASISRIDATTGEVLGVTDVDIGGEAASVTDIPGFSVTERAVWALVRLDGSPFEPIMVRIDPDTGQVLAARTVQIEGNTWAATADQVWFHRAETGSIIAVDVDEFDDAEATAPADLIPATTVTPTTAPPTSTAPALDVDVQAVTAAFERFIDPTVAGTELALGQLATTRDELLDLLDAQVGGEARLTEVIIDSGIGTARFDVVVEGDTVVLPGIEFVFEREPGASTWTITRASLCTVAEGAGIPCP